MSADKWHHLGQIFRSLIQREIDIAADEDFVKRIEREPPRPVDSATDRGVPEDLKDQYPDP